MYIDKVVSSHNIHEINDCINILKENPAMIRLKRIYNNLNSFDKSLLELFYQLKFSKKSQRWNLYQTIKKKEEELDETGFETKLKRKSSSVNNKGALSQLKKRLRFDIESILLLRILSCSKGGFFSNRFLCCRFLILADYYLENNMPDESQKKLNQAFKIINYKGLMHERLIYNELHQRLVCLTDGSNSRCFLEDALSTLKAIEYKLINEVELIGFRKSVLYTSEIKQHDERELNGQKMSCLVRNIISIRKKMLKEWKMRNYPEARKLAKEEYLALNDMDSKWNEIRLECLLHMAVLNIYSEDIRSNTEIFDVVKREFELPKKCEKEFLMVQFLTCFLDNCLEKCQALIYHMEQELAYSPNDKGIIVFYKALLLFKMGNYQELSNLLQKETIIFSLPNNVGLNARLLELYNLMASGERKLCGYRLEAFRQAVMRSKTIVTSRYLFIERLLHCFLSNGMDTAIVWEKYQRLKLKYGETNERFKQDVEGFELISIEKFISDFEVKDLLNSKYEEVVR